MSYLMENGIFTPLNKSIIENTSTFSCGNVDLDDFFHCDCIDFSNSLFGKSYCFVDKKSTDTILCAFTVSNACIFTNLLPSSRKHKIGKQIPNTKRELIYPAVLIGRLGVNNRFQKLRIGSDLMDFIKSWFTESSNKTGCRYLVVDAYNSELPIRYYLSNGFDFMFSTETQEKEYRNIKSHDALHTRLMYFDLIRIIN